MSESAPVVAETERLRLRGFAAQDLAALVRIFGDPEVMRYIGLGGTRAPEAARRTLERCAADARTEPFAIWSVERREAPGFIGWCGLAHVPDDERIEVAYLIDKPYWGRGYATEAARAALSFAFERANLDEIIALARAPNVASINVMRKLGMRDAGTGFFYGGEAVIHTLSAAEYFAARER
ncbi:MAG: GNAT family N-acetyltransferase [Candidatus Eremiobacteraeota bacterium]|nr:GNAT family N-acetyltransferase [Candidatus Eremiobacteraeota bacterium]